MKEHTVSGPLGLDDDSLAACVQCGLCLPHCPTYRITGDERWSPRGRISLMRSVEHGEMKQNNEWYEAIDTCIGCLGCVTACPSGVPYGELIAATRNAITAERRPPLRLRIGLRFLSWPRLVRVGSLLVGIAQRLGLVRNTTLLPERVPIRVPSFRRRVIRNKTGQDQLAEVVLFTGCVMDAWQPHVHEAVIEVLEMAGVTVEVSGDKAGCCGALHEHSGLEQEATIHAERVVAALSDNRPVLVDSAGCGAALKQYGELLGTEAAANLASRVFDVHEWCIAEPRIQSLMQQAKPSRASQQDSGGNRPVVVVQDPCHLRHGQGCHGAVREILAPFVNLVELDDDGLCCGAGGTYQVLQPGLAALARDRKVSSILRASPDGVGSTVISANPGCALHLSSDNTLANAGFQVLHPMEVFASQLREKITRSDNGRRVQDVR